MGVVDKGLGASFGININSNDDEIERVGVSAKGGIGTVVGALVIASINNCMSLLNADVWLQYMVKGSVLVIAVLRDRGLKPLRILATIRALPNHNNRNKTRPLLRV